MKTKSFFKYKLLIWIGFAYLWGCEAPGILESTLNKPEIQVPIDRVETMPNLPQPYHMEDWHQKAQDLDTYLFDSTAKGPYQPFIWFDHAKRNFPQTTFGLYTAVGDVRQGPAVNNGEAHEAICVLGALLGASLVGIDKSNQNDMNYVKMIRNYFNSENGWNIIMNFTNKSAHVGGGYGNDFWYDVFNNVLFYALADHYPDTEGFSEIQRTIADQLLEADQVLGDNYSYSFFDFKNMQPGMNHVPPQEDVTAGFAYILYAAYIHFGDEKYLAGVKNVLDVLYSQKESRFYEILLPFGAYVAARMNAEQGTQYDPQKLLDWTFDGTATNRKGWGVISARWGNMDVHGLVGSTIDRGGYGFLMNTFDLAWPLISMVRYDQRFARAIGKWLLNAANAARLCYPYNIADSLQIIPDHKSVTKNLIGYEGLIHHSRYPGFEDKSPVAQGDGPLWAEGNPPESMFSVYGSGHVGIFGSIIRTTNIDQILQLNCLATDMYKNEASFPTYLYFNPHSESKTVDIEVGNTPVDLYDSVRRQILVHNATGKANFSLDPDAASVIVLIPHKAKLKTEGTTLFANGIPIDFLFGVEGRDKS